MGKRYLVIEDDTLSRKVLEKFFSEFSSCDTAADGATGYRLFEQAILEDSPYDLICTDITMPGLSGHDLIKKIRDREQSLPIQGYIRTTIFVISASNCSKDMESALLDSDCDDYIVKPFRQEMLKAMLEKYNLLDFTIP
jgi:two-component system chemotaxis response regulator CheY